MPNGKSKVVLSADGFDADGPARNQIYVARSDALEERR